MKQAIFATALAMSVVFVRAQAPATLGARGRANANVSMTSAGRLVAAVWSTASDTGDSDIDVAISHDAGATFSQPVRVNKTPGSARVGGEQPPRVALVRRPGTDPDVVVVWTSTGMAGTRLVSARSNDGGRTFGGEVQVPGSDAAGNRGWEDMTVEPSGRVDVIWLDHRDAATGAADMSHHMDHQTSMPMQADSVARAQLSKLYFASLDGTAAGRPIAGGVCYCCKTAVAAGVNGAIYAAWRHVYDGNVRDIAFTMSTDRGRTFAAPVRVSQDGWAIDGCPENGPALALDSANRIHIVWPTFVPESTAGGASAGALELFYASSSDGQRFTPRQKIPTAGTPRHVQIVALDEHSLVLGWDESGTGSRHVVVARATVTSAGRVEFARQVLTALGDAQYPALTATPDGVVVAATSGRGRDAVIKVTMLPARR